MRSKILIIIVAMLILSGGSLLTAGCGGTGASSGTIKLGAVLSLSGPNEPLGTPEANAINLFVKQLNESGGINGRSVEMVIKDDASDPNIALDAANTLIEQDNVLAIVGGSGTGTTLSIKNATNSAGVPQICCSAGVSVTQEPLKWIFRTPLTDAMAAARVLNYITGNLGMRRVAVLYDSSPFGTDGMKMLDGGAADAGVEIVAREPYQVDETAEGMDTHLTKIQGENPQALIVWGTNPGPAKIAGRMQAKGMTLPFIGSSGIANQKFIDDAAKAADGVAFPSGKILVWQQVLDEASPQGQSIKRLSDSYQAAYGQQVTPFTGHGWDSMLILEDALKRAEITGGELAADRNSLRDAIEQTKSLPGIAGIFNFSPSDHDGLKVDDMIMVRIVDGRWTPVQ